jgi:polyhydroxyalkanoate synthase
MTAKHLSVVASASASPTARLMQRAFPRAIIAEDTPPVLQKAGKVIDRATQATLARLSGGLSPASLAGAYLDWALHLAAQPGKQLQLADKAARKSFRYAYHVISAAAGQPESSIAPLPQDHRFDGEDWRKWPFNSWAQAFLLTQQWWHNATTGVGGVTPQHEKAVSFAARQMLDMFSPSNFPLTNPAILRRTVETGGMNLVQGWQHWWEDTQRQAARLPPEGVEAFKPGETVAVTPGAVVFRNELIELIQYAPTTARTRPEPILITPAWIMKYYILDLSPENSLVKYLTGQGFTVFMISWKNPGEDDRNFSFDDYRKLGPMAALGEIERIIPQARTHAVGYCIGGTLLAVTAAAMARDGDHRLASMTLFAAQTDFTEAGELMLFTNDSQINFLENVMWEQGYLEIDQMSGAFHLLRSNDLVWSRIVHDYMMGERTPMNDLMAWNADGTRMPYRMHSEYLRKMFLQNQLVQGKFEAGGAPVALGDIEAPIFAVGTTADHVAPWRSVFKIHLFCDGEVTFVLTNGGHNAGIVSEPGHKHRHYQMATRPANGHYVDPDAWAEFTPHREGSWWPAWAEWLAAHSGAPAAPPAMGEALCKAPGAYVLMK